MGDAIVWWIAIELLGLAAVPVGAVLLRALPDRGYSLSKPLGLLLVGWLAYTLAMLHVLHFDRLTLVLCLLALAGFSTWLLLRKDRALLYDLRAHFSDRSSWVYVIVCEALFLLAFIIWAWIRAHEPAIKDQEKFMDFGFLNAILKSDGFPPNDMWLAGFSINYYYFGYILIAGVTALSGVATAVAFNLANVTLFALTALGVFGIVHNLITARLLAAGRTARAEARQAAKADSARGGRLRGRETYPPPTQSQLPQRQRRSEQVVPASRPPQSRRRSGASASMPVSGLPSRRNRIQPDESQFEEATPEELEEHIEAENDIDTMEEVAQEQAGARTARRRRRRRRASTGEQDAEQNNDAAAAAEAEAEPQADSDADV